MIIDLPRFVAAERPSWTALEKILDRVEASSTHQFGLEEAKQFHFLYQKAAADLARIATFASEPELRRYLETLVARAYGEIHETRERGERWSFVAWFTRDFPRVVRRHFQALLLSILVTLVGVAFGGFAVALDPEAKESVLPEMFADHLGDPAKRVAEEERASGRHAGGHASFAGFLMVNNIKVSITCLALGMTFGLGTLVALFYNGVLLGLVAVDYVLAGYTVFLLGWLMPHGVIEIPAILLAGQGGLMLGKALVGWADRAPLRTRLRAISGDLMTLIGGVAVLLVWAAIVESFVSQYHAPVVPYWVKIAFGTLELGVFVWFLAWAGREKEGAP